MPATSGEGIHRTRDRSSVKSDGLLVLGEQPALDPLMREVRDYGLLLAVAMVAAGVAVVARAPVTYVAGGLVGLAFVLMCARRPVWGCAALVLGTPLIAGLGRGTVIPFLRPSEAMLALLIVGVLMHEIPRRRYRTFTTLDVTVLGYTISVTLIPVLVLLFTGPARQADSSAWFNVAGPLQYLAVFLLFSRIELTDRDRRLFLNLAMAASVVVCLVGMAELANVPGVQTFVTSHWADEGGTTICQYGVCRPSSLLQHYSAFGAFSVLNYTIALALLTSRSAQFDRRWLVAVLGLNAIGVFVSETVAAVVGLVLATAIILLYRRAFPRQLVWVGLAIVIGAVAFWGPISARIQQQSPEQTIAGIGVPQTIGVRVDYWEQLFWPALQPSIWTGTGDVIPTAVPTNLSTYVDSEYLGMGFRAGIPGVVLLLLMLGVVALTGWRARRSRDALQSAVGGMVVTSVITLAVMGTTAEYLTFAGVAQVFWMVVGLLASFHAGLEGQAAGNTSIALTVQASRSDDLAP